MEYIKGRPYFCDCETIRAFSYLKNDCECEVLFIGGGIDGAIANFYLSQNHDVILVDKGRLGFGCTACATALLFISCGANGIINAMKGVEVLQDILAGMENPLSKIFSPTR